jgi:CBS domain-containing protein
MNSVSLSELLSRPASDFVQGDVPFLDHKASVKDAAARMRETGNDSVIITSGGLPVGILTERDLCYRIVAEGKDPAHVSVGEVMSTPLITMAKGRPLQEALSLMVASKTRRLVLVNADGTVFGVVTRWGFTGEGTVGALALPVSRSGKGMVCPFCASLLDSPESLSKHIDRVHIGGELSEGRVPLWTKKE